MLETLRAKPHHIKQSIALGLTIFIFCGVLFVWVSSWDARARNQEVRDKTVSPITGVTSMFDGLLSGFNERMTGSTAAKKEGVPATTTVTFDLSGVVIIDPSASSTKAK